MSDQYLIDGHKAHLHPARVAQWLEAGADWEKAKKVYPLYVEISPVGQCNHRCSFCAVDYIGYKPRAIARAALERCLADMATHGVKSVMYAGEGEPLLYRPPLFALTRGLGLDVALTTNATPLREDVALECLPYLTWLKASVNAGDAETYAKVHGTKPADFGRVITNLGRAAALRKEHGWKVTLGAQLVLLPDNWHTVHTLAHTCRDIGLDYLVVKPYSQHPKSEATAERYGDFHYGAYDWLDESLRGIETDTFKVVYRTQTMANLQEPTRPYTVCHSTPNFWAYIMASGDVYGCGAHLLDDRFRFGNIHEQSFPEIWEGERRRACLEMMGSFDIGACRKNCRMEHVNRYLVQLKTPAPHANFI